MSVLPPSSLSVFHTIFYLFCFFFFLLLEGGRRVCIFIFHCVFSFNKLNSYPHDSGRGFLLSVLLLCSARPFLPLLGVGFANELTDCSYSSEDASIRAGVAGCDIFFFCVCVFVFVCGGNFIRPKAAILTPPPGPSHWASRIDHRL